MATPQPIVPNQLADGIAGPIVSLPLAMDEPLQSEDMDEPQSEADRLREVFQDIDTWVNSGGAVTAMFDNHSIDQTYVGSNVSREFNSVLFKKFDDNDANIDGQDQLPSRMDASIALNSTFSKALDLYYRYKFLVGYLEAGKGTNPIETFIRDIRQDAEASPHWQFSSSEEFKYAWHTLWTLLCFPADIDIKAATFEGQIRRLFPGHPQRIMTPTLFSINLTDLEGVELRVKPTLHIHNHLLVEGNTVNILAVTMQDLDLLGKFKNNRAAKALGIASLGEEILSSLNVLYARDEFFDKAEALGIFSPKVGGIERGVCVGFIRDVVFENRPKVLAGRAYTLQKLVKYRLSWWPSLVRDMKRQFQAQPLFFYGTILALFFGICTVIQTVASVWSLALALRAMK